VERAPKEHRFEFVVLASQPAASCSRARCRGKRATGRLRLRRRKSFGARLSKSRSKLPDANSQDDWELFGNWALGVGN
jgi:hypothetical protein